MSWNDIKVRLRTFGRLKINPELFVALSYTFSRPFKYMLGVSSIRSVIC